MYQNKRVYYKAFTKITYERSYFCNAKGMQELNLAIKAAEEAGELLKVYSKDAHATYLRKKSPRDILLKADLESEKLIFSLIKRNFPLHSILSEESGEEKKKSEFTWIVDPLDGSVNFYKGSKNFCVLISLLKGQKTLFGVALFPLTEELYVAQRGNWATKNGQTLKVSNEDNIKMMLASTQISSKLKNRKRNMLLMRDLIFKVLNIQSIGFCIGRALCDLAEGITDFHFKCGFNFWDYAAGSLLVEEAGGRVTDFEGNDVGLNTKNILASNGKRHNEILEVIAGVRSL